MELTFGAKLHYPSLLRHEAFDVIENAAGNFYALVGDTLYEFDPNGNIIREDSTTNGFKIYELPNGNIIVQEASGIVCKTFGGNIIWNIPSTSLFNCTPAFLFGSTSNGVVKD
jgi:hypothetical protein